MSLARRAVGHGGGGGVPCGLGGAGEEPPDTAGVTDVTQTRTPTRSCATMDRRERERERERKERARAGEGTTMDRPIAFAALLKRLIPFLA